MSLFKNKYRIESTRLPTWDYSSNGYYYVTICTKNRKCLLGNITDEEINLSKFGNIVLNNWLEIPNYFQNVILDEFVIMPNHMHSIVVIENDIRGNGDIRRDGVTPSLRGRCNYKPTLGQIIGYFKYKTTKIINIEQNTPGKQFWQRGFYERIIRNEIELNRIQNYISNNPIQWQEDRNKNCNYK